MRLASFVLLILASACLKPSAKVIELQMPATSLARLEKWVAQNSSGSSYQEAPRPEPVSLQSAEGLIHGELRLRGDLKKHWTRASKSWRFESQTHSYKHLKEFDLIIWEDKYFELESLGYLLSQKLGLLSPQHELVSLTLNEKNFGGYLLVERWTADSLARRGLPTGEFIKENNAWLDFLWLQEKSLYKNFFFSRTDFNPLALKPQIYEGVLQNETTPHAFLHFTQMLADMTAALAGQKKMEMWSYIDFQQATRWSALMILMGAPHATLGDNLRWYYHPSQRKFRPIPYDFLSEKLREKQCLWTVFSRINPWMRLWGKEAEFQQQVRHHLSQLVNVDFYQQAWNDLQTAHDDLSLFKNDFTRPERKATIDHNRDLILKALAHQQCLFKDWAIK